MWRTREIYYLVKNLQKNKAKYIDLSNNLTINTIKNSIKSYANKYKNLDSFLLDVTYILAYSYIDSIKSDDRTHTLGDLLDYIKDVADKDDGGQIFKIYDKYKKFSIYNDDSISIILTTIHKVKGLEFDAVVIPPSFADLPLSNIDKNDRIGSFTAEDNAVFDEEMRLMFVAYTRAKKYLYVFISEREEALLERRKYTYPDKKKLGIYEPEPKLSNYYISYIPEIQYSMSEFIRTGVKINDNVDLVLEQDHHHYYVYIEYKNKKIGRLSSKSNIGEKMYRLKIKHLSNFFISEVIAWEYSDSIKADKRKGTNYSERWHPNAKKDGFFYLVIISGFDHIN